MRHTASRPEPAKAKRSKPMQARSPVGSGPIIAKSEVIRIALLFWALLLMSFVVQVGLAK